MSAGEKSVDGSLQIQLLQTAWSTMITPLALAFFLFKAFKKGCLAKAL